MTMERRSRGVVRSSPASRAGLEVRDVIVTVGGYQVGRVAGRLYTLDRELELRADRRGNVSLLVLNHRNSQLTPLGVQLATAQQRPDPIDARPLRGTVSTRRGISLAGNATLSVRLLDVTDRRRSVVVRQRSYRDLGPLPLPFELVYTPSDILPDHKYALSAEVTVNGSGHTPITRPLRGVSAGEPGRGEYGPRAGASVSELSGAA